MGSTDKKLADDKSALLHRGAMLCLRIFTFPKPVVLAVTGHALALGAILLLAGDLRIGPAEISGEKQQKLA